MVGVPRRLLQQHIQEGRVATFEGYIRMSELRKAYPDADSDSSGMLEKVKMIQQAAILKDAGEAKMDPERLATELHRASIQIAGLEQQVESYRELAMETEQRLLQLQEQCERREASMLGTLISWYMNQIKKRDHH